LLACRNEPESIQSGINRSLAPIPENWSAPARSSFG